MPNGNQDSNQLQTQVRDAIWNCIDKLQGQLIASTDPVERETLNDEISKLRDQLAALRAQSLQALNDSITAELNAEADNIATTKDALDKAAEIVEKATKAVGDVASLAAKL